LDSKLGNQRVKSNGESGLWLGVDSRDEQPHHQASANLIQRRPVGVD
jgi:hypothetical protein